MAVRLCPARRAISSIGTPSAELVESNVPTLLNTPSSKNERDSFLLVDALHGCTGCGTLSSDAMTLDAISLHLVLPDDEIAGHRQFFADAAGASPQAATAALQVEAIHAFRRMLHQMQFCSFSGGSPAYV